MYENEKKWGKHIQDAERLAEEMHEYPCLYKKEQLSSFNSIFINIRNDAIL